MFQSPGQVARVSPRTASNYVEKEFFISDMTLAGTRPRTEASSSALDDVSEIRDALPSPAALPPSLEAQARARLPPGSPWLQFKVLDYIAAVSRHCSDTLRHATAYLDTHAKRPRSPSEDAATEAKTGTMVGLLAIWNLEDVLIVPSAEDPFADRKAALRPFLPESFSVPADMLKEPAPDEFAAYVYLAMFREIFPLVRRLIVAFTDNERRVSWQAWTPDTSNHLDRVSGLLRVNTEMFDSYYYEPYDLSLHVFKFLLNSRPVRRRVAQDLVFLDSLSLGALATPFVRSACFTRRDLSRWTPSELRQARDNLDKAFDPLRRVMLDHPKPYKDHTRAGDDAGAYPPARLLCNTFGTLVNDNEHLLLPFVNTPAEQRNPDAELVNVFLDHDIQLRRAIEMSSAGSSEQIKEFNRARKINTRAAGNVPDACDHCDKPADHDDSLRRCSRCRTAQYCATECQTTAWKSGRKLANGVKLQAHKIVCVDAKPKIWKSVDQFSPRLLDGRSVAELHSYGTKVPGVDKVEDRGFFQKE